MSHLYLLNRSLLLNPPRFPVASGVFVVGRSSGCDLVVRHSSVSRRHAEIKVHGNSVTVVDLHSRNGTYVNNERIESSDLMIGQKVTFGGVPFVLMSEDTADEMADSKLETADHGKRERPVIPQSVIDRLSEAQCRVLVHLVEGLSEKDTAERLCISPHTVHNHVRDIYGILGVHSRAELLLLLLNQ
jgi:pSer/pThr/pTyr-binding forkhead associated (FHA) protein